MTISQLRATARMLGSSPATLVHEIDGYADKLDQQLSSYLAQRDRHYRMERR
jgi:hypothetical protein